MMRRQSKILIVDDEPFNVDYLEQELEDLGYATVSAYNGREALDKVAQERPDLILLDIMMPVMDRLTVCRLLKGDDETRLIPIVIMTALDGLEERIHGIEAGADDFLDQAGACTGTVGAYSNRPTPEAHRGSQTQRTAPGQRPFCQVRARSRQASGSGQS